MPVGTTPSAFSLVDRSQRWLPREGRSARADRPARPDKHAGSTYPVVMRLRILLTTSTAVLFALAVVVLSLSDRAPAFVPAMIDLVVLLGQKVESIAQIDVLDRSDARVLPGRTDQIGHAVLWGSGMLALGYLLRHRIPVAATALGLLAASIGIEFLQVEWTATRELQASDVLGNAVGIALATGVVIVVGNIVDLVSRIATRVVHAISGSATT